MQVEKLRTIETDDLVRLLKLYDRASDIAIENGDRRAARTYDQYSVVLTTELTMRPDTAKVFGELLKDLYL